MRIFALIFVVIAVAVGWFFYPPMRADLATWRFKLMSKSIELLGFKAKAAASLGYGPPYTHLRYPISTCPKDDKLKITKEKIGGIPALLIRPISAGDSLKPALVFFHGGGWVVNSPDVYCGLIAQIARRLQIVVVAFDYRKAPEAPYPAAFDDCLEGLLSFASDAANFGVDRTRVAVAGDSAGGNLALAVTGHLHSGAVEGATFRAAKLALIYPVVQALDFNLPAYHENAHELILTRYNMARYWYYYITGNTDDKLIAKMLNNSHASEATRQKAKEVLWGKISGAMSSYGKDGAVDKEAVAALAPGTNDPLVSPILFSDDVLRQLPPVYLLACRFDVLRDEAFALANRLVEAKVLSKIQYSEHYHGVLSAVEFNEPESIKMLEDLISFLEKL